MYVEEMAAILVTFVTIDCQKEIKKQREKHIKGHWSMGSVVYVEIHLFLALLLAFAEFELQYFNNIGFTCTATINIFSLLNDFIRGVEMSANHV